MEVTIDRGPFTGLYAYEIALLAMGVVLFAVAIWALVRAIRSNASPVGALSIFPFVLVFAGYPSIKAVNFGDALKIVSEAAGQADTTVTPERKHEIDEAAATVLSRLPTAKAQAVVANAYRNTGELDKAYRLATQVGAAPSVEPEVKRALVPVFAAKLEAAVREGESGAAVDPARRETIAATVRQLDATGVDLPAQTRVTVAQGYAALGDEAKANINLDQAQAKQRDVRVDPRLLRRLQRPLPDGG